MRAKPGHDDAQTVPGHKHRLASSFSGQSPRISFAFALPVTKQHLEEAEKPSQFLDGKVTEATLTKRRQDSDRVHEMACTSQDRARVMSVRVYCARDSFRWMLSSRGHPFCTIRLLRSCSYVYRALVFRLSPEIWASSFMTHQRSQMLLPLSYSGGLVVLKSC